MHRHQFETRRGPQSALVWQQAGPSAPWLHFGHATGMHALLYARFLTPLADQFNIIAADFRGHGESPYAIDDRPANPWEDLAEDTLALIDAVAPDQLWWLLGHSLGGVCAMVSTTRAPERVAGLMMLEPPLLEFPAQPILDPETQERATRMVRLALKRRPHFPDRASAEASYRGRGVFRTMSEDDLMAYLDGGLAPGPEGVHLRCPPHWEAATFNGHLRNINRWPALLTRPYALLAGARGSTVPDEVLARFAAHPLSVEARRLPGTDHFMPLQASKTIRERLIYLVVS